MSDKTGGPAFPVLIVDRPKELVHFNGMTLRDYFSAKAMQAMIQTPPTKWPEDMMGRSISVCAYEMADSMLKAREQ
jgi:hypothetical protein